MQKTWGVWALGYSFSSWARWAVLDSPLLSPTCSLHPVLSHLWWDLSHLMLLITHQSSLSLIPGVSEVATLLFFLFFFFHVSDLSIWFNFRELSGPSPSLAWCQSPSSSAGMSIYNMGPSQPSGITAWSFPCNAYCISFYSFFYTFNRLYNTNNVIQIIIL